MEITEFLKDKIIEFTSKKDYEKGKTFPSANITFLEKNITRYTELYQFRIKSALSNRFYFTRIEKKDDTGELRSYCTCPKFYSDRSCKHVAACIIKHPSFFFHIMTEQEKIKITKELLETYIEQNKTSKIKEEVHLEFEIEKRENYYRDDFLLHMKIGTKKKYSLNNKLRNFLEAYQNNEVFKFGKDFTYDPEKHFFSEVSKLIINTISGFIYNIRYNELHLSSSDLKILLPLLKNQTLKINNHVINKFEESCPYFMNLKKEENYYSFKINVKDEDIMPLTSDNEFLFKDDTLYQVPLKIRRLMEKITKAKLEELIFDETDINTFSKSVLPIVKNELKVDSSVENLVIVKTPGVKLYFDFKDTYITAKIKFDYAGNEIDYFDDKNTTILRDNDFENILSDELLNQKFIVKKKQFVLEDLDDLGNFLDSGLEELSKKYEVYTSEKVRNTNINKNNKVTTSFGIGKDNIMHFDFQLENVDEDEITKILASLKKKKKYFRLKSGDLLSLENNGLEEFQDLMNELDMTYEEILANNGIIPKYYALYLDSLKNGNYNIIKTNNQFDKFIQDFKKYQNLELKFTKEELNILRDYQVEGIKWLYTIYKCGFGGILADEMGLGKSLQTITFFQKILKEKPKSKFLIVAPTSLLYNWKNEFNKFAPEIQVELLSDVKRLREEKIKRFDKVVYVTSYGLVREDLELYKDKTFEVCVIDEAQNIKNPKSGISKSVKTIQATQKLALTGTPIENSVTELWSIFDFIMPGFLSSLTKFQEKYRIHDFDEKTNKLLKKLKEQVKPFILRRKKQEVAKDLPPKIENTIYIDLSEEEKKIYASEVKRVKKQMEETIEEEGFLKARFEILKLLIRLRQLCISPKIVYDNYHDNSSKFENLMKVVKEVIDNGHKILLFTSFRTALDLVRKEFSNNNITSYTIDGSVPSKKRAELVDKFNEDDTNVFLIMLKSGGTGLNLTSADVVIHLDLWWNPQAENQATDRTHRIGQNKTVEVIKLVTKGTIEERILELQEKKQVLSDKLIESDHVDTEILKRLTEEDIRNLLSYENK